VAEKAAPVDPRKPAKPVSSSALAFPENYVAATADGVTAPALRKN
jgi:penicillin-binding protein 1A